MSRPTAGVGDGIGARSPALPRAFFARPSPQVARELLGCCLVRRLGDRELRVQISETEAYLGTSDPASHAFRGLTSRNSPMFGPAGTAYVYFVYGMHHCFNVVTGQVADPQAVLLRGAVNGSGTGGANLSGPARLCRSLAIDLSCNGWDLCSPDSASIWLEPGSAPPRRVLMTPRVGVRDQTRLRFLVPPERASSSDGRQSRKRAPKGSLH
ncbi:MAG: DNA-3-methyladenine glycosylase [Candidatus Dormibacteria bacterium]